MLLMACHQQPVSATPPQPASATLCRPDSVVAVRSMPVPQVPDSMLGRRGAIVGVVLDPSGPPLNGAMVAAYRAMDSTRAVRARAVTGTDGVFQLGGLEPGRYELVARRIGSVVVRTPVTVRANAVKALVIRLCSAHLKLERQTTN
jgi:hypothetical protein